MSETTERKKWGGGGVKKRAFGYDRKPINDVSEVVMASLFHEHASRQQLQGAMPGCGVRIRV